MRHPVIQGLPATRRPEACIRPPLSCLFCDSRKACATTACRSTRRFDNGGRHGTATLLPRLDGRDAGHGRRTSKAEPEPEQRVVELPRLDANEDVRERDDAA